MSLYFFDCVGGNQVVGDDLGLELPNLHAARIHAMRIARRMMVSKGGQEGWGEWAVEISDRSGQRVLVVPFSDALKH